MAGLLTVNIIMGLIVLWLSCDQAINNTLKFYPSTLITILHAAATCVFAFVGFFFRRFAYTFLLISSVSLVVLPISCFASGAGYPGGDDGGGFGWLFYVGGSSLLAMIAGIITMIFGVLRHGRKHQSETDVKQ